MLSERKNFAMKDGLFTVRGRAAFAHDFNADRLVGAAFQALVIKIAGKNQRRGPCPNCPFVRIDF
jgi:hypothetical protein